MRKHPSLTRAARAPVGTALLLLGLCCGSAQAVPLNPSDFASLGAFPGAGAINTDTLTFGAFTGVAFDPGSGALEIAVFTFDGGASLPSGEVVTAGRPRPLALLFQGSFTLSGTIDASAPSGFTGGPGGGRGGNGGPLGPYPHDGVGTGGGTGGSESASVGGAGSGGGGFGTAGAGGGAGGTGAPGGSGYGDLTLILEGGSGGGVLLHAFDVTLNAAALISADGGDGASDTLFPNRGGCGGAGRIQVVTNTAGSFSNAGTVEALTGSFKGDCIDDGALALASSPDIGEQPSGGPPPAPGIPEPTTLALFAFGLAGLGLAARRRRLN